MTSDLESVFELGGVAAVELAASALAQRGAKTVACANCGEPLIGPYCAICGQERDTHRRSVRDLVGALFEELASFDSRILRTMRALLVQPGELPLAFHEGRTRRYVPALRLYLFVSLLFFLFLSVTGIALLQFQLVAASEKIVVHDGKTYAITQDDEEPIPVPAYLNDGKQHYSISTQAFFLSRVGTVPVHLPADARERLQRKLADRMKRTGRNSWVGRDLMATFNRLASDPAAMNAPLTTWIPRALFLLLPAYALVLAAFYWRQRRRFIFVDHLIFSLNLHSFAFVALITAAVAAQIMSAGYVGWLLLIAIGVYLLLAVHRFYRQSWTMSIVKFLGVTAIYTAFFLLPAFGIILGITFLGG
jgi:hypothetical protein